MFPLVFLSIFPYQIFNPKTIPLLFLSIYHQDAFSAGDALRRVHQLSLVRSDPFILISGTRVACGPRGSGIMLRWTHQAPTNKIAIQFFLYHPTRVGSYAQRYFYFPVQSPSFVYRMTFGPPVTTGRRRRVESAAGRRHSGAQGRARTRQIGYARTLLYGQMTSIKVNRCRNRSYSTISQKLGASTVSAIFFTQPPRAN